MEKEKIVEGNKLIASFMGFIRAGEPNAGYARLKDWCIQPFGWFDDEGLKYHTSWDWLMPVVEKIERMDNGAGVRFTTSIEGRYLNVKDTPFAHCVTIYQNQFPRIKEADEAKITAVWQAVVAFITWYNQLPK
jgi:hypothetical protein